MNIFFKSKQAQAEAQAHATQQQPSNSTSHDHHLLMNNLKTHFTNFIETHTRQPPWARIHPPSSLNINSSLIQQRFADVPVYRMSFVDYKVAYMSDSLVERGAILYCLNKADCETMASHYIYTTAVPLSEAIESCSPMRPNVADNEIVRLIPELSQIKNALQRHERSHDDTFPGVPVFQSKAVRIRVDGSPGILRRAAFFRKEDLEKTLHEENKILNHMSTGPDLDQIIEVTSLEEIIQNMQTVRSKEHSWTVRSRALEIGDKVKIPTDGVVWKGLERNPSWKEIRDFLLVDHTQNEPTGGH